jgi:hypothetical protein
MITMKAPAQAIAYSSLRAADSGSGVLVHPLVRRPLIYRISLTVIRGASYEDRSRQRASKVMSLPVFILDDDDLVHRPYFPYRKHPAGHQLVLP